MFEVGRRYKITTMDHDGQSYSWAVVSEWSSPLLKIDRMGTYEIINTSSPSFVGAEPDDAASKAAKEEFSNSIYPQARFVAPQSTE